MISLKSFAVLVHEAHCPSSEQCSYINTRTDDFKNEYEHFRTILIDLGLLRSKSKNELKTFLHDFIPTRAGFELLAAHNINFSKENHE